MPSGDKVEQTFIFDFDDLLPSAPGVNILLKIKEHYPDFKCTCFTPAIDKNLLSKKVTEEKMREWGKMIGEYDWIEIAPHGFGHYRGEWMITDKKRINLMMKAIENTFDKVLKLPYVKVFKYPYWEGSKEAEEVLKDRGYTLAINRDNPVVHTDIPTYVWSWSIDKPIPEYHTIKAHGHMHLTNNGLDSCYPNLLKLPTNAKFLTVGEYLCQKTIPPTSMSQEM